MKKKFRCTIVESKCVDPEKELYHITLSFSDESKLEIYVKKGKEDLEPVSDSNACLFFNLLSKDDRKRLYEEIYVSIS